MAFPIATKRCSCSGLAGSSSSESLSSIRAPCRHSQALHFSSCTKGCRAIQVVSISGRFALIRFPSASHALLAHADLAEEILHEAPPCQGRLEKVGADESREQEPIRAMNLAEP